MKIKLLTEVAKHGVVGDVIEVDDFLGAAWVFRNVAEEVKKVEKPKPKRSSAAKKATKDVEAVVSDDELETR